MHMHAQRNPNLDSHEDCDGVRWRKICFGMQLFLALNAQFALAVPLDFVGRLVVARCARRLIIRVGEFLPQRDVGGKSRISERREVRTDRDIARKRKDTVSPTGPEARNRSIAVAILSAAVQKS
jgi:hypothetical protein